MAKKPKFTIRPHDRTEFKKLRSNMLSKFNRLEKRGIDIRDQFQLPKKIDQFGSRQAFNEFKEQARDFTNRNNRDYQFVSNKHGLYMSKREYNRINREVKKQQRTAEKLIKEAKKQPFYSGGVQQGTVGDQLGQLKEEDTGIVARVKDFNFDSYRSTKALQKRLDAIERRSNPRYYDDRQVVLQENFINILETTYNSDADATLNKLRQLPPDLFYQLFLTIQEVDFDLYDSDGDSTESANDRLNRIDSEVQKVLDGMPSDNVDPDLKGFN